MSLFTEEEKKQILKYTVASKFDNAISSKYKKAISNEIPLRYLITKVNNDILFTTDNKFILSPTRVIITEPEENGNDNKEEDQNEVLNKREVQVEFENLFQKINEIIRNNQVITLLDLWQAFSVIPEFRSKQIPASEFAYIWLHAIPSYRISHPQVYMQIKNFYEYVKEPLSGNDMIKVLEEYNNWYAYFTQLLRKDYNQFLEYTQVISELDSLSPFYMSPFKLNSVSVLYEYITEKGIDPLPEIFAYAKPNYLVPYIKYNIREVYNNADPDSSRYKIYAGKSSDTRPQYENSVPQHSFKMNSAIICTVWTGADPEIAGDDDTDLEYEARFGKKEGFHFVELLYYPERQRLEVSFTSPYIADVITERDVISRIHSAFPNLPSPISSVSTTPLPSSFSSSTSVSSTPSATSVPTSSGTPGASGPKMMSLTVVEKDGKRIRETEVSGSFQIYDINYIEFILIDQICLNKLFRTYLFIEESGEPYPEKRNPFINFRSLINSNKRSIATKLSKKIVEPGETLLLNTGSTVITNNPISVINVDVTKATSQETVALFMEILSRLFRRYRDEEEKKIQEYLNIMPQIQPFILMQRDDFTKEVTEEESKSSITNLKKMAPDIVVKNYARLCQKQQHPKVIFQNEIPNWQAKTFTINNITYNRQIMAYPFGIGEKPKYLFVCPNDNYPFPGVSKNTNLSNRKLYPYIPCCYTKNHIDDLSSKYNLYRTGRMDDTDDYEIRDHEKQYILKGDKILETGQDGYIPTEIETYLAKYKNDDYSSIFIRFAPINYSENTFLHCVFRAFQVPDYMSRKTMKQRKEFIDNFRENLFKSGLISHALVKQELYDMSYSEIENYVTDNSQFFDPLVFYRIVEEIFNCNVFIFSNSTEDSKFLNLPRYKLFHSHIFRPQLPSILVMRHFGSSSTEKIYKYPTCELICEKIGSGRPYEYKYLFEETMTENLFAIMNFMGRTMTWSITETRNNIYSLFNYREIFGKIQIVGQVLDSNGKARLFCIAPQITQENKLSNLRIFINVLPTAPLNVPEFDISLVSSTLLPSGNDVLQLFGNPSFKSLNSASTECVGFWFPIGDIEYGIYCQIIPIPITSDSLGSLISSLKDGSDMTARTILIVDSQNSLSDIQRIKVLRKAASFIMHIFKYLYVTQLQTTPEMSVKQFLNQYTLIMKSTIDSVNVYNIGNIPRILPKGTVPEIIANLASLSPNLFPYARILVYNEEMLKGILYQLEKFRKSIEGLNFTPDDFREIPNYYNYRSDYKNLDETFLLMSTKEFNSWYKIYVNSASTTPNLRENIQLTLTPASYLNMEPYIYQGGSGEINPNNVAQQGYFIVQNVAAGDLLRAINVAYNWFSNKINLGFTAEKYKFEDSVEIPAHVIYKIGPNGRLLLEKDKRVEGKNFLEILNYGNNYAALLKL